MINPVSSEFVLLIHAEKERELERRIELIRTARERGTIEEGFSLKDSLAWFSRASEWVKAKVSSRAAGRPASFEPCPTVPCS